MKNLLTSVMRLEIENHECKNLAVIFPEKTCHFRSEDMVRLLTKNEATIQVIPKVVMFVNRIMVNIDARPTRVGLHHGLYSYSTINAAVEGSIDRHKQSHGVDKEVSIAINLGEYQVFKRCQP